MHCKSGMDPGLRTALNQNAIITSGQLKLFKSLPGTFSRLTQDIHRNPRRVMQQKVLGPQFMQRDQPCARNMRRVVFWGRANIQQSVRLPAAKNGCESSGRDRL